MGGTEIAKEMGDTDTSRYRDRMRDTKIPRQRNRERGGDTEIARYR